MRNLLPHATCPYLFRDGSVMMYRKGFLEIHSLLKRDSINISPNQQELIKLINIIELVVVGIRRHRFLLLSVPQP